MSFGSFSKIANFTEIHPDNRHVRDKISQQLQVLAKAGFLIHVGSGRWQLP